MRPMYENAASLEAETSLKDDIERAWRVSLVKLPISYAVDYAAVRGKSVAAWFELKCRTTLYGTYDTYMLSLHKWQALKSLARIRPSFLVVRFVDGPWFLRVQADGMPSDVVIGGRFDRGDPQDIEPVVLIDMSKFEKMRVA